MEICSRVTLRQGAALFLLAVAAVLGCSRAGPFRNTPEAVLADPAGEEVQLPPPPQDTVALPTETDLALDNARQAEVRGDLTRAQEIYERALESAEEPSVTEIQFQLARLFLDPAQEAPSIEQSRDILQAIVETAPGHIRHTDARAMLWLIDEVAHARGRADEVAADNEELQAQVIRLKADRDEKDQQLERIKQVLLQTKP